MTSETVADEVAVDVSQDWMTACDVQQRFMQCPGATASTGEAVSYGARCRQVRALGGDCYDFVPLGKNRLAFAIGDASGKSVAAALMIASVQASLRTAASFAGDDPAAVVGAVSSQVYASSSSDRYATLFYGVFDESTRVLRYVNAGHNPPVVIREDGSVEQLEAGGVPVGIFPDWRYQEGEVALRSGDVLVAYTDGVTEATSPEGEEWGLEGLLDAAVARLTDVTMSGDVRSAEEIIDSIFGALDEFSCGRQTDDATVAVLRVN